MDDFVVGVLAGTLLGLLLIRSRRDVGDAPLDLPEPVGDAPRLEVVAGAGGEEYEDPGKVERQLRLEQYRRLLREEFGVDHAGSVIDPATGEGVAAHE